MLLFRCAFGAGHSDENTSDGAVPPVPGPGIEQIASS